MMLLARVLLAVLSLSATSAIAMADDAPDYRANLSGTTVPMTVNTQARGEALFWISEDRQSVRYRLSVSKMENVTMAQLQLGKADTTGPVLVWLYPERPPPKLVRGMFTGVLAEGSIKADNLLGPLQGRLLGELIAELKAGNTYVHVHSNRYPEGEIRGQVE